MDEDNQYNKVDKWLGARIWLNSGVLLLFALDALVFDSTLVGRVLGN